jgi:putative tributyrin esterase
MALIHCNFFSHVLGLCCSMDVILPQPKSEKAGQIPRLSHKRYPTLWLLHGMSDDQTIWQRRTSIERYVEPLQLAVVMPAVGRSFYTDMEKGARYWTFISEELPVIARSLFPLSDAREDNFVAGLSMGGYGAFKLAFSCPQKFAAAASLSGALDMATMPSRPDESMVQEMTLIFGDLSKMAGSKNDLFFLAKHAASSATDKPRLYQWCGTEDFLYQANVRFLKHAQSLGMDLTYGEGPGAHEWRIWDQQIQEVLAWLPLKENKYQKKTR